MRGLGAGVVGLGEDAYAQGESARPYAVVAVPGEVVGGGAVVLRPTLGPSEAPLQARGDAVVQEGPESAYQVSEGVVVAPGVVGPRPGIVQPTTTRAGRGLRGRGDGRTDGRGPGCRRRRSAGSGGHVCGRRLRGAGGRRCEGGGRGTRRGPAGSGGRVGGRRRCRRAAGRRLVGGDRGGGGEAAGRLGRRLPILPQAASNRSRATRQGGYMVGGKGGVL